MDILKILEESGKELYPEDLDFFETELATGSQYDAEYQKKCRSIIEKIRKWMNDDEKKESTYSTEEKPERVPKGLIVEISDIAPTEANRTANSLSPEKIIWGKIKAMRESSSYKADFKKYVTEKAEIDSAFVDINYALFLPWEIDAIISVKQMGENFLEKYFDALDHDKIARYQMFSESFFIKHFSQLNTRTVLEHGKNTWRKKENRSKQLDVFLRLKGVKY